MNGRTGSRPLGEVLRDEMTMKGRIAEALRDGPKTIPEIAEMLAAPAQEITLWVMAMHRYGALKDLPKGKADDYYRYGLVG